MKHSEEHYRLFFGRNANYYLEVVTELAAKNKARFNLPAFFLGFFWMLYRKLYIPILIIIVIGIAEVMIEDTILITVDATPDTESFVTIISTLVWASLIGFFANRIYLIQANKKITKILSLNLSEEETNKRIKKAGGTSLVPHLVLLIIVIIIIVMGKLGYYQY